MITKEKMQRYQDFNGDLDKWVLTQKNGLDEVLSGPEWTTIDKVVQRLRIQKNGNASVDYRNETDRLLKKSLESDEVIEIAKTMV